MECITPNSMGEKANIMVKVTFYDMVDGDRNISDGPYESVQVTRDLLRDDDDRLIASFDEKERAWLRVDDESGYYSDFTIEATNDYQ